MSDPSTGPAPTEQPNPATSRLDTMSTLDQVRVMNDQDALVAGVVRAAEASIAATVDAVTARLRRGGRLLYTGAGTPGRLGILDASEVPPTFGSDQVIGVIAGGDRAIQYAVENAEDDRAQGAADLDGHGLSERDAVVGIAASGRTPYVLGALEHARAVGAFTAGVVCNPGTPIAAAAEVAIEVLVGPEVITGSTRLKSGTAQKLVLNMISTLTMVQLGKTYGNLMVDVSISNAKLRQRGIHLVSMITEADDERAAQALDACGGSVKVACVSLLLDVSPEVAADRLVQHDGFLRAATER